jgi:hypothetical protein
MIKVEGNWVGRITGTNNGNVFVELKQENAKVYGVARINEPIYGMAIYNFTGVIENEAIVIDLVPDSAFLKQTITQEILANNQPVKITVPKVGYGNVHLNAKLVNKGSLEGIWKSTLGTGGKVFLANETTRDYGDSIKKDKKMIFISYSHEDKDHLKRLNVHLKPLQSKGLVEVWDDTKILAGQKWQEEIKIALSKAAVAVLIISADFLASDFVVENELPPILKKAELEGTRIMPIILKPCRFSRDEHLSKFQALNAPDKPLLSLSDIEQEETWDRLSQAIEIELNR